MRASLLIAFSALALASGAQARQAAPIDPASHYSGVWLEVGRTPMRLTKDCVAGTTRYVLKEPTHVDVVDDCRQGGVDGKRRAISGRGRIEDPGVNRRLRVAYAPFIVWRYVVMDRDPEGQWFIAADPELKKVFLYTRSPPSKPRLDDLEARVRRLGYVGALEFPAVAETGPKG
ncbi:MULTISPECIES: lipocalin family protein [Caulobacter]|uniref:Outer membrane lipoprotein Blc n=1 Tax=Caulobacter vibrioides OR37 TaxID=1292034 RepID=R0D0R2_CAUVI|nr:MULTISPECIES: lipocalin family protein [Caulobacter]ENZ82221.1 bacterial lipocalin [Caulobacter vibrioides OR37]MBQ1562764.1 lipocalin family protein [Caulobacter sp.]